MLASCRAAAIASVSLTTGCQLLNMLTRSLPKRAARKEHHYEAIDIAMTINSARGNH